MTDRRFEHAVNPLPARLPVTLVLGLLATNALAAEAGPAFPARAIRLIVPSTPGGVTDVPARAAAEVMREVLGQPVILDNRPGAGGKLGAEIAARAPADGHTLFVANGSAFSIAMATEKSLPYDALRDFSSVALLTELPGVLAVYPAIPAKTVAELVAYAKERPGKVTIGTAGVGSGGHIVALRISARASAEFVHVPYKGEQQAIVDAIAGHVPVAIGYVIKPYVEAGQLRPVASLGRVRAVHFPELPTLIEQGYPGVFQVSWNGISAPAKTPPAALARLNAATNAALQTPRVRKLLAEGGFTVTGGTRAAMDEWVASEVARYRQVIAEFNLTVN
jgi:tripartite-type tricarboxylate transporter receptor subunit TctC